MGILNELDSITAPYKQDAAPLADDSSAFSKGLRSGATRFGGALHSVAGQAAEGVGADEVAADQRAQAAAANEQAAQEAQGMVQSYKDVKDLRSGFDYATGTVGSMLPGLAAGAAGGLAARFVPGGKSAVGSILGNAAGMAPQMIGEQFGAQQADPAQAAQSFAKRTLVGTGVGAGQALAMAAVPGAVEGKLAGKVAEDATAKTFMDAAAHNVPGAVVGNAGAGAASTALGQAGANYLDPNRDTSGDLEALKDSAIEGGIVGAPFGALGAMGDMRGKKPPSIVGDGLTGLKKTTDRTGIPLDGPAKVAPDDLGTPESKPLGQHLAEAKAAFTPPEDPMSAEVLNKKLEGIPLDEQMAALDKHQSEKDAAIEAVAKQRAADRAARAVEADPTPEGAMASKMSTNPVDADEQTLRSFIKVAKGKGEVESWRAADVAEMLDTQSVSALSKIYDGITDPGEKANFLKAMTQVTNVEGRQKSLTSTLTSGLKDNQGASSLSMIKQLVPYLRSFYDGELGKGMNPAERATLAATVEGHLADNFVDPAKIAEAFAKDELERNPKASASDTARKSAGSESDQSEADAADAADANDVPDVKYYGNDRKPARGEPSDIKFIDKQYLGDFADKAQAAHLNADGDPTHAVNWMSAKDYAAEHGIGPEKLAEMTAGKTEPGVVRAEGTRSPDAFSPDDAAAMQMDAKYKGRKGELSKSEIKVGDTSYDATRITSHARDLAGHAEVDDGVSPLEKMKRNFLDGVASLSEHHDAKIEPKDDLVVGRSGGKDVTYKDLKDLPAPERKGTAGEGDDTTSSEKRAQISELGLEVEQHQKNLDRVKAKGMTDAQIEKTAKAVRVLRDYATRDKQDQAFPHTDVQEQQHDRAQAWLAKVDATLGGKSGDARKLGWEKLNADRKTKSMEALQGSIDRRSEDAMFSGFKGIASDNGTGMEGGGGKATAYKVSDELKQRRFNEGELSGGARKDEPTLGVSEVASTGQVHLADKEHGKTLGDRFAKSEQQDAGRMPNHAVADKARGIDKGIVNDLGKSLIETKINSFGVRATTADARGYIRMARELMKNWEQLNPKEQKQMYDLASFKTLESVSGTIGGLYKSHEARMNVMAKDNQARADAGMPREFPAKTEAQTTKAFRTLAASDGHTDIIKRAEKSTDAPSLQQAVSRLVGQKHPNEATQKVVHALNERISALIGSDPYKLLSMDPAKNDPKALAERKPSAQSTGTGKITEAQKAEVVKIIRTSLGDSVTGVFKKAVDGGGSGLYTPEHSESLTKAAIQVSLHAKDPTGVAYHESLHALFDQMHKMGLHEVTGALDKTASSPIVMGQLAKLLKDEPAAWKQAQDSREERAAYMYQFWAKGDLKLGEQTNGVFERIGNAIKKVLGIWTANERAEHIMKYFSEGSYAKNIGERSVLHNALVKAGRNESLTHLKEAVMPIHNLAQAALGIGGARIRDMGLDPYTKIAELISQQGTAKGEDRGYVNAYSMKARHTMNQLGEALHKFPEADVNQAWKEMQLREKGTPDSATHPEIKKILRATIDGVYKDMLANQVKIGHLKDYTPVQWDAAYIAKNQDAFLAMAKAAIARDPSAYDGSPESLMNHLMRNDGNEIGIQSADGVQRPGNMFAKERIFTKLTAAEKQPFLIQRPMQTLSSYVYQGTRRAEWAKRFRTPDGNENGVIEAGIKLARDKHGASSEQEKVLRNYIDGVNGSLGNEISPNARKTMSTLMVVQNLRLLGLGWFSGTIDPLGVKVRGGTWRDALSTYKLGMTQIFRGFSKNPSHNDAIKFGEDIGAIESAMLGHAVQSAYGMNTLGGTVRKANDWLFKYNLMEQQSRNMRAGAAVAAAKFIARHNDGAATSHSQRYMEELGLKPKEALVGKDGNLLALPDEIRAHYEAKGLTGAALNDATDTQAAKMRMAINTWVDGAVVRPDATKKAIWMNDPHFALVAHMKAYTYAFHETILKRAVHEAEHGNYQPMTALAAYVPTMLAADLAKGMIQGGGSLPAYQQDWTPEDFLWNEVQRAGMLSTGQVVADEIGGIRGHSGWLNALGPTASNVERLGRTVAGGGGASEYASALLPNPLSMMAGSKPMGHSVGVDDPISE